VYYYFDTKSVKKLQDFVV